MHPSGNDALYFNPRWEWYLTGRLPDACRSGFTITRQSSCSEHAHSSRMHRLPPTPAVVVDHAPLAPCPALLKVPGSTQSSNTGCSRAMGDVCWLCAWRCCVGMMGEVIFEKYTLVLCLCDMYALEINPLISACVCMWVSVGCGQRSGSFQYGIRTNTGELNLLDLGLQV